MSIIESIQAKEAQQQELIKEYNVAGQKIKDLEQQLIRVQGAIEALKEIQDEDTSPSE